MIKFLAEKPIVEKCSSFGACSVTCGEGVQTCSNTCLNGKFGDDGCPEDLLINSKICTLEKCIGTKNEIFSIEKSLLIRLINLNFIYV